MELLAFDTETHLMGFCNVLPKLVCCSLAFNDVDGVATSLAAVAGPETLDASISSLFDGQTDDFIKVAHNAAFDLGVLYRYKPELISGIFTEIEEGRVHCTIIREKLLHLSSHGDLRFIRRGNFKSPIKYNLSELLKHYLNIDITAAKKDGDAWRLNYSKLEDVPVQDWPQEAWDYAVDDAKYLLPIWHLQEEKRQLLITERGIDPFATLSFRVGVDFCLKLMTAWGISIDPVEKAKIETEIAKELTPEHLNLLIETGILRPAKEGRPYKRGTKNEDGTPKMTEGKPESINKKKLVEYIEAFAARTEGVVIRKTKKSDKHPEGQTSAGAEFMEDYWHLDPVLEQFRHRQSLQKMVTTEIPRMNWEGQTSPVVHPNYDVLKETGRTSSFGGDLYPSFNCQNVQPRARACYVARDGHLFLSSDYNQMELGTTAQKCFELFGASVMRDKINAGIDLHEYLGSQLAFNLESTFADSCAEQGATEADQIFEAFSKLKHHDSEDVRAFFKLYRTFAKPTGLGYPGGLGPKTFIQYAKATFGVVVSKEMAEALRTIWRNTFPEMVQYHNWINTSCEDPYNVEKTDDGERKLYAYSTPMGMYRAGCTYCAAANGASLQSPSAEGATLAVFNIGRACYDPAMNSILYGVFRPIMFIHDEIFGELPDGDIDLINDCAKEIEHIMIECMRTVTPDVEPRVESVLTRRWDKFADPTHDAQGRLVVTEEKGKDHGKEKSQVEEAAVA